MNKFNKLAAFVAVGLAPFAVFAQSDTSAQGTAPYGQFRPLEGQQAYAEQTAATPAGAPAASQAQPVSPPEQPAASAPTETPTRAAQPIAPAPYGYGPGAGYAPGLGYANSADPSWARYQARKRMMWDRNQFRRYATPRHGYGRYSRFAPPYGMRGPHPGAQPGAWASAPAEGQAPEATTEQSAY